MNNTYKKTAEIYKLFCNIHNADFSEQALIEMYEYETYGRGILKQELFTNKINGYYVGKKWLNVTVSMWKESIKEGSLFLFELYKDNKFPSWWLNKIFKRKLIPINFIK